MDKIIGELILNVVGKCSYQFEKDNVPYSVTKIHLLSESWWSIHTFVDEGKIKQNDYIKQKNNENIWK